MNIKKNNKTLIVILIIKTFNYFQRNNLEIKIILYKNYKYIFNIK
jgi:hypothetical protein